MSLNVSTLDLGRVLKGTDRFGVLWLENYPETERPLWKQLWNRADLKCCSRLCDRHLEFRNDVQKADLVVSDDETMGGRFGSGFSGIGTIGTTGFASTGLGIRDYTTKGQQKSKPMIYLEQLIEKVESNRGVDLDRILILGGISGRFDHLMATIQAMLRVNERKLCCFMLDGDNLVVVLPRGRHDIKLDNRILTGKCGLSPFCQEKTNVSTKGFRFDLQDESLSFDQVISSSNQVQSDIISVKTSAPVILNFEVDPHFLRGVVQGRFAKM